MIFFFNLLNNLIYKRTTNRRVDDRLQIGIDVTFFLHQNTPGIKIRNLFCIQTHSRRYCDGTNLSSFIQGRRQKLFARFGLNTTQLDLIMLNAVNVLRHVERKEWGCIRIADLQVIKEVARSMNERVRYNPFLLQSPPSQ